MIPLLATCAALLLGSVTAVAQPVVPQPDASRGELLYATHCIACHTAQVHWRDSKLVTDWPSLRAQVLRWQATAQLAWSESDVDEVTRYLNRLHYHFAPAGERALAPRASAVMATLRRD